MRRAKTTAKPIKIAPSEFGKDIRRDHRDDNCRNSSNDEKIDGGVLSNGETGFIIGNNRCDELNSAMGGMTVGSLPCVRRGRRSVVTSGGNEMLFGGHAGHGNGNRLTQNHRQNGRPNREMLATSMPVPHAPFLSSRRGYETGNNLSSIPAINLTRSAAGSMESESITYGSLRESTFTRLNTNVAYISNSTADKSSVGDKASGGFAPQSLPRMRLSSGTNVKNNGIRTVLQPESRGGIASLFGGGDSGSGQSGHDAASGGITNDYSLYQEGISNSNIGNLSPRDLGQTETIDSGELIRNINKNNGIGSVDRGHVPNEVNSPDNGNIPSGSRLGTSLTGLDILRSSQPGIVDLTLEQRESLQKRVRVMGSYDGLVSPSISSDIPPSSTISVRSLSNHNNGLHAVISRETQAPLSSFLIPPRNMTQAHETEDVDGYDNRPPSPDDIFDMDE